MRIVIVIVNSKLLKRHSKAKRRAPAYSRALRQIRGVFQRIVRGKFRSGRQTVRGGRLDVSNCFMNPASTWKILFHQSSFYLRKVIYVFLRGESPGENVSEENVLDHYRSIQSWFVPPTLELPVSGIFERKQSGKRTMYIIE